MAEQTTFGNIIVFFKELGIYDIVLPFLLVFTIVFAILEKTKVFGTEKIGTDTYTKKNLNAMTAFVVAFLVIASTKLVAIINEAVANIVLLLMLSVFFLLLIGSFRKEGEGVFLEGGWERFFMVLMFVGIVLIFLNAIKLDSSNQYCSGQQSCSFLTVFWNFVAGNWNSRAVGSIILLLVVIFFMWLVTKEAPAKKTEKKES